MANVKIDKKWTERLWLIGLCIVMVVSVLIMLRLCADEGIDYDEAYSFKSARDYTHIGIVQKMIDDFDTDVPLYYNALRVWIALFGGIGHRFFAARIFSVAGAVASLLLGITVIRRQWGNLTALFYMVAIGLAPAMLHVNVNIRMYSWTNFMITSSALLAFFILQNPKSKRLWFWLGGCTVLALFSHYFTMFAYLAVYLFLLVAMFVYERKQVWKVIVCGGSALTPLVIWMFVSGFFHFVESDGDVEIKKLSFYGLIDYLFKTDMRFWMPVAIVLLLVTLVGGVFFVKGRKMLRGEKAFILTCFLSIFVIYLLALFVSSFASHFFSARHIMHATAMMWLGIAIILPRINKPTYVAALVMLVGMCHVNFEMEYGLAYRDTPYLEETKEFIATQMQPGDIVIYNSTKVYSAMYGSYMPDQEFVWRDDLVDIQALAGKRVWFLLADYENYFTEEEIETYGITEQNMGHYGFQLISNLNDFDILRVEIRGAK